jgi:DNA-binding transcriptional MocR family regulator
MLQSSDLVILFALLRCEDDWTLRSLAARLGVKHSKVQRSLGRLEEAGLFDAGRRRLVPRATEEFLVHALKYLHPVREGAMVRGVPTAWGGSSSAGRDRCDRAVPGWPDPRGEVRGPAVEPLDPVLPQLVDDWPQVAELAALADALRLGDARTRAAAERLLVDAVRAVA